MKKPSTGGAQTEPPEDAGPVRLYLQVRTHRPIFVSVAAVSSGQILWARARQRNRVPGNLFRLGLLGRAEDVNGPFHRCLSGDSDKLADPVPALARAEGHMPAAQPAVQLGP